MATKKSSVSPKSAEKKSAKKVEKPPRSVPRTLTSTREPKKSTPGKFSLALVEKICERVAAGEALYRVCEDKNMPSPISFYAWVQKNEEARALYNEALNNRAERFADQITEIADEAATDEPEYTNAHRLRVDARKWVAARLLPKKYGDKIIHSGDAENPLVTQLVVSSDEILAKIRGDKK